jgi:hypothetical protein
MYNLYELKKKLCIYPLSRIHNTSLISAYLLDSRECKCLEYLSVLEYIFILYLIVNI